MWLAVHLSARIFDAERSLSGLVWKVVFLICYSIWYWLSYTYNSSVTKRVFSSSIVIGCANAGFKMRVKGFTWLSASHLCLFGAFSGLLRLFLWLYIHFLGFGFGFLEGAISGIIHGRYQKGVSSFRVHSFASWKKFRNVVSVIYCVSVSYHYLVTNWVICLVGVFGYGCFYALLSNGAPDYPVIILSWDFS